MLITIKNVRGTEELIIGNVTRAKNNDRGSIIIINNAQGKGI